MPIGMVNLPRTLDNLVDMESYPWGLASRDCRPEGTGILYADVEGTTLMMERRPSLPIQSRPSEVDMMWNLSSPSRRVPTSKGSLFEAYVEPQVIPQYLLDPRQDLGGVKQEDAFACDSDHSASFEEDTFGSEADGALKLSGFHHLTRSGYDEDSRCPWILREP
jgi:hypothetical protein